ncbi:hypothetical protein CEXT_767041 [Caerostris extrusa]|uniref:Uncharacterized protein n=1 Tax=Caerostris extrusa TaxID=172846 RepID=A0AAV4WV80_CAEEX|nr:hypothetical protein CEXT_767041 [Caerostris extrusa]
MYFRSFELRSVFSDVQISQKLRLSWLCPNFGSEKAGAVVNIPSDMLRSVEVNILPWMQILIHKESWHITQDGLMRILSSQIADNLLRFLCLTATLQLIKCRAILVVELCLDGTFVFHTLLKSI